MVLIPTVKWAQRTHCVYLTIDVQDSKEPQVELNNTDEGHGHLTFKAVATGGADDQLYELDLILYKAVDNEKSKITKTPRGIFLVIEKQEEESWPRLTKDSGKHLTHIKVDWDKWVDSDDEGEDNFDPSAMGDFSGLGGMGGMGGMGGLGGMGGMPGMGGMGGMGGMDFASMMKNMGGAGGLDAMDFAAAGAGAGAAAGGDAGADEDSDDEDLPELEA